jgi:hypothetical protein
MRESQLRMALSLHPALLRQMAARDQSMSEEERLTVERGEKEAVALRRGWMQVESEASVLKAVRAVLQSDEMPEGMRETLWG